MASLLDYVPENERQFAGFPVAGGMPSIPTTYNLPQPPAPPPAGTTGLTTPNFANPYYPGTNFPINTWDQLSGPKTKDDFNLFQAMLWRQSGGQSGAPMPEPEPDPPWLARAKANPMASIPRTYAPFGGQGVPNGTYGAPTGTSPYRFPNGSPALIKPGVTTTIKNPNQANRLTTSIAQFSGPMAQAKQQSLTDFTQSFLDDRKKQRAAYDEESAFVGSTFDPKGLEAKLAGLARNRSALGRQAAEEAIRRAGRSANVSRMMAGGNSSYLDRAYSDQLGRILLENAMKGADQSREDAVYLQQARTGALGARRDLGRNFVGDAMMPYNTLTDAQSADLANLGRIGSLEDSYSLYDYVAPDEAARRNLGMLGDLEETNRRYVL